MPMNQDELKQLAELEEYEALQQQYGDNKSAKAVAPVQSIPKPVEIAPAPLSPEISMEDSALAGAAQGATFGFSDELGAGKDVALGVLKGEQGLSGLGSKWRELQKQREAANAAAQQANPGSYFTGELAGGLATTPLMPGLGGTKAVGMLGKLSPKVAAFLAGQAPGALTRMAGTGAKLAIEGAPLGALYGVGSSEADISKPEELAKDAASSAAMGSIGGLAIGAGVQGGKEALKAAGNVASKYDLTRKLGQAYNLGNEGVSFTSSEGAGKVAKLSKEIPLEITKDIMAADKQLGKAVGDSLNRAEQAGVRINIDPELKQTADETFKLFTDNPILLSTMDPKSKKLILKVAQDGLGDMSPLEARALKDTFNLLVEKTAGLTSDVSNIARQRGMSLASSLDKQIKAQIPEYAEAASQFANFRSSIPEVALQPGLPSELRTKDLGSLKNKATDLYKGISNVFSEAHIPGSSSVRGQRAAMGELAENLKKVEQKNPEAIERLGGTADEVAKKWRDQADRMAVLKQSQGVEPHQGVQKTLVGNLVGSGEGFMYGLANKAGQGSKIIGQSSPVKKSQQIFSEGNDALMGLANTLKTMKGAEPMGEALEKALMNKDEMAKNAVLFKLLQIPEYRSMLREPKDNQNNQ